MEQRSEETDAIVRADRVAITAVVPTYNEEQYITQCLAALLSQQGLEGDVEILVVDGCSRDRTAQIVRSFPEYGSRIRLLSNPRRLQVYAWNIGLREARGEYYAMIGAHAEYGPTYFFECLQAMKRTSADGVGGVALAVGEGAMGRAIAWCMSSPFGVGNARFRYADREQEADSVFALFSKRRILETIGGFDESLPFDEDADLNYRLRRKGYRIVVSPRVPVRYAVRRSLRALWKQMNRYGYWRRFTQRKHGSNVPARTYAPAALIAGLLASAALAFTPARIAAPVIPAIYFAFLLTAAIRSVRAIGWTAALVPAAAVTMHVGYGWGWWTAAFSSLRAPLGRAARNAAR